MAAFFNPFSLGASAIPSLPVSSGVAQPASSRPPGHVKRLGIFGGTFDPVHLGHLILAETALEELDLDGILFIPAWLSPHKTLRPPSAPSSERLEMLRLAIAGKPAFSVDDRELRREGPSYAIDTVRSLLSDYPGVRFLYLIGEDNLPTLDTWNEIGELRNLVDFAVLRRDGGSPADTHGFQVVGSRVDISSTGIRERLAKGLSARYFLPASVLDHIISRRLYLPEPNHDQT